MKSKLLKVIWWIFLLVITTFFFQVFMKTLVEAGVFSDVLLETLERRQHPEGY